MKEFYDMFKVYALFGKKVARIVEKNPKDRMNDIIICPYCGKEVSYGKTMLISGHLNCPNCHDECVEEIIHDKEHNRERYENHDYQPYGLTMETARREWMREELSE